MNTVKKFKIHQSAVKCFVILCGIGFTLYSGMLCLGIRNAIAEFLGMTFGYALIGYAVWVYELCLLSWAFLIYTYMIRCCILLQRVGGFGEYIDIAHTIAFSIGAFLTAYFLFNHKKYFDEKC